MDLKAVLQIQIHIRVWEAGTAGKHVIRMTCSPAEAIDGRVPGAVRSHETQWHHVIYEQIGFPKNEHAVGQKDVVRIDGEIVLECWPVSRERVRKSVVG